MINVRGDRFKNVASKRVQSVIDDLEKLSKCSNKSNYDYEKNDIDKMFTAIKQKLKVVEDSFRAKANNQKNKFSF